MVDAYDEELVTREGVGEGERRTLLRLHPRLAPVKAAVLPLVKKDGQPELAGEVFASCEAGCRPSTTTGGRSGGAIAVRTRSERRSA